MEYRELFEELLGLLEQVQRDIDAAVPPAKLTAIGTYETWRYETKDIYHALVLKLARLRSALRAAYILLRNGHIQEQAIIHRVLDETNQDILFLAYAVTNDEVTDLHKRYLEEFWEEEVDEKGELQGADQKRGMIPRKKIQAYLSKIETGVSNPHRDLNIVKGIHKTYSGFVHGAAPHIMELYGGSPPKFHVSGMLGTPKIEEYTRDLWNHMYRSLISYIICLKAFGEGEYVDEMIEYKRSFEQRSGISYEDGSTET